jgi:hypothetical protein
LRTVREEEDRHELLTLRRLRACRERANAPSGRSDRPGSVRVLLERTLPELDRRLQGIADRSPPVDQEVADAVDRLTDEVVVRRRRGRDLRLAGEGDQPDAKLVRDLVEKEPDGLLRCAEPRRLNVLGLHRARRVDDEDDGRTLVGHRAVHLRSRGSDEERRQGEGEERRRDVARPRAGRRDRREDVEVREADRVAHAPALREDPHADCRPDEEQAEQEDRLLEAQTAHPAWT